MEDTVRLTDEERAMLAGAQGEAVRRALDYQAEIGRFSALAARAVHPVDVTVTGARQGGRAEGSLASSMRLVELDAFTWSNNAVRVLARNVSGGAFDLGAATLSLAVTKRRAPRACSPHTGRSSRPRTGSSSSLDKHFAETHGSAAVVVRAGIPAEQKKESGMAQASSGDVPSLRAAS